MSYSSSNPDKLVSIASVFTLIQAPILSSVEPVEITRFLKERERYEIEIMAKQWKIPTLQPLP